MLYRLVKPVLFRMDPENAHHLVINAMRLAGRIPGGTDILSEVWSVPNAPELTTVVCGLRFPHPIGLAAGLDKNGVAVKGFSAIGFGFVEVGTVTPRPQPGNDRPRLFRLPPDEALINRMGFNNSGADAMAAELSGLGRRPVPVGVNIGKNKTTPNERAEDDYQACIRRLYRYADFFVVNISSPNTPGLRNLQHGDELRRLLGAVTEEMRAQEAAAGTESRHPVGAVGSPELPGDGGNCPDQPSGAGTTTSQPPGIGSAKEQPSGAGKPVFVKIAPDMSEAELELTVETIAKSGVSGIIATNTTVSRDGLTHANRNEAGGLSGRPLARRSTETIARIYRQTNGRLPIIGCGGIFTAQDAYEKIRAGASLVEIYTSLIYKGPNVIREIHEGLRALMARDGFTHISQAVGTGITS